MAREKPAKGPQFVKYFTPVIEALRELGGSGHPSEVQDVIATRLGLSDRELEETIESGATRFYKKVHWARFYLSQAGYIDPSIRGVWSLTDTGRTYSLSPQEELELFKRIHKQYVAPRETDRASPRQQGDDELDDGGLFPDTTDHRSQLVTILRLLPPSGFESLCQALLREAGFESVTVTGRPGDGGLDGIGVLQVNPLVSFKVLFQCKRYTGSLGPDKVRDFRGAMAGRADKGIILTTGFFTPDAKREAVRDGVPPIELVDVDALLDMFERLQFGLKPKQAFDVDLDFFKKFESQPK
jgi:restriction system protein